MLIAQEAASSDQNMLGAFMTSKVGEISFEMVIASMQATQLGLLLMAVVLSDEEVSQKA